MPHFKTALMACAATLLLGACADNNRTMESRSSYYDQSGYQSNTAADNTFRTQQIEK